MSDMRPAKDPRRRLALILGAVVLILAAVMCELRRRSGSLLAAAALHWATNGLGVLLTAALATARLA